MAAMIDRRWILNAAWASAALGLIAGGASGAFAAQPGLTLGRSFAFSFDGLKREARRKLGQPYAPPPHPEPAVLDQIDYDAWGQIKFDSDAALFKDRRFPVTFFPLGKYFRTPVQMFAVEDGRAREIIYDPRYFDRPATSPARALPNGAGFAGLRIQETRDGPLDWRKNDWAAFLGASYFRAIGALHQYGLSARAAAIDTAVEGRPEVFPAFTKIFIEEPASSADGVTLLALIDSPSLVGACRFVMTRGEGVVMDIDQTFYLRRSISRFGLAPLTSMYWFSETVKPTAIDWRPEVHDSDGLAMWTGRGERLWRPLNNPPQVAVSAFVDKDPKGFGLMQRDRVFDHYLDGVRYDRRPSLWVAPKAGWGNGAVQLIELPTDDEDEDNIVAAWVPDAPALAGATVDLGYTLYWLADEPFPSGLARCVATRLGRGGQAGQPRPQGVRKFVVEFLGGPLTALPFGVKPRMALHASRGRLTDYQLVEAVPDGVPGHWRTEFDLADVEGFEPVELRLQLTVDGRIASETWLFQYHPF